MVPEIASEGEEMAMSIPNEIHLKSRDVPVKETPETAVHAAVAEMLSKACL
jgi:hypothetical protein